MPANPTLIASLAEWRTVMAALQHYRVYLAQTAPDIEDEDAQLVSYDHLERLERIVPGLHGSSTPVFAKQHRIPKLRRDPGLIQILSGLGLHAMECVACRGVGQRGNQVHHRGTACAHGRAAGRPSP